MLRSTVFGLVAVLALLAACSGTNEVATPALAVVVNDGGDPAKAWVADTSAPARPAWDGDWVTWAAAAKATPLSGRTILLSVQGLQGEAKVKAVRVKVIARRPAVAGTQYVMVGPDPVSSESLSFDLDGASPAAHTVEAGEGDTIAVTVQTQQCDCDFVVELDWPGGTRTVDDDGKPFRVSATTATVGRCVTYPDRVEKCETF